MSWQKVFPKENMKSHFSVHFQIDSTVSNDLVSKISVMEGVIDFKLFIDLI